MELSEKEYDDCKEQFLATFIPLVEEFYQVQLTKFSKPTARKYFFIANTWIEFIYGYTDCLNFSDITVSQINSKFWSAIRYEEFYGFDSKEVKNKLKLKILF